MLLVIRPARYSVNNELFRIHQWSLWYRLIGTRTVALSTNTGELLFGLGQWLRTLYDTDGGIDGRRVLSMLALPENRKK